MTIYSQHPNRGKVQILATYQSSTGITSSTLTSLADAALATPIVDALNRISALATVPVSVHDARDGRFGYYPQRHLAALTDRGARADLINGAHSLWYELVNLLLYRALTDLDNAMAAAPPPVRTAIDAEMGTEVGELRDALAEFSEGVSPPETESPRYWNFESPFVAFDGGMDALSRETRESLDRLEKGITNEQREKAVPDLRLLVTAYAQYLGGPAVLETANFEIFNEPGDSDGYYLTVNAPQPGAEGASAWHVEIGRWEPDDPEDEESSSATGQTMLRCACVAPPAASEIADLLSRSEEQLAAWAGTPVGAALTGTTFVVTEQHTI
jgi:hypothetical protein